jgi:four helix bundle protein
MSEPIRSFRDLIVWQRAMDYAVDVHQLSKRFPREEMFSLTLQLRKSSQSTPFNIAEGHGRKKREFSQFLSIAAGSLAESESQLLFAVRVGYLKESDLDRVMALAEEVRRMISGLLRKLED